MDDCRSYTLITGANGEFGHGLINEIVKSGNGVIVVDLNDLSAELAAQCDFVFKGNILDSNLLADIFAKYKITEVFHLAALLSTSAEKNPELAFDVNLKGTLNLLSLAHTAGVKNGLRVKFLFPSSIAVYGIASLEAKIGAVVKEDQFLNPITMYGVNKLACENLGAYYANNYMLLDPNRNAKVGVDFRAIRFPGVISAFTLPTGGTSDFAPEMIHAAAKNEPYKCFVRADAKIPFITMPDAVAALTKLGQIPEEKLTQRSYNIGGFAASAEELANIVKEFFPDAKISFEADKLRQMIIDSWPEDVDDSQARADWDYQSLGSAREAFDVYLIPNIRNLY